MRALVFRMMIVTSALALAGCGSAVMLDEPPPPPAPWTADSIDVSLAELLQKPRAELAQLTDEWTARVQLQEKAYRESALPFTLLPELRLPLILPVWREAFHSVKVGFSLPPYLKEGSKDNDLALHLARFGDTEAARLLAEDDDLKEKIEASRYERNYPVEWTRLAALMLHAAQRRLATGDTDGGKELVALHLQLKSLLDPKAARGPLGAVLLSPGRRALTLAANTWRDTKCAEMLIPAEAALAEWGKAPAPVVAVVPGAERSEVARLLRSPGAGRALTASAPLRALDLFGLPIPAEGVQAITAQFDSADRLVELLVLYRPKMGDHYPEPGQLAHPLEDHSTPAKDGPKAFGLHSRTYQLGDLSCAVTIVPHGEALGAMVRFSGAKENLPAPALTRDFGAAHLDRSFEQNRLRVAPHQRGDRVATNNAKALARVTNLIPALHPAEAILQREPKHEATVSFTLRYAVDNVLPGLFQLAQPLWSAWGPSRFDGIDDEFGGYLALSWEDETTGIVLRLPYSATQLPQLEVRDRRLTEQELTERDADAVAFDRVERQARFAARKAWVYLPRHLELETVTLGMTRAQVLRGLPAGQSLMKRDIEGGLWVTFKGEPPRRIHYLGRDLFVRFGPEGKAVELRMRYDGTGATTPTAWTRELTADLQKRYGVPAEMATTWSTLWADLPAWMPAPTLQVWLDDITLMTCQCDGAGAEVTLRECTAEHENGVPVSPLRYLPKGTDDCYLGEAREDLYRKWEVSTVTTADGATVLTPKQSSPYDVLLVWFEQDRAVRIVARHKSTGAVVSHFGQMSQAVNDAWGRDSRSLGWPRRQDFAEPGVVQGLSWHDDQVRVRIFWQDFDQGPPRMFTEWREWNKSPAKPGAE